MHNLDALFAAAEARRHELRAIAKPQPIVPYRTPNTSSIRHRLGQAIVRLGTWIDDHCPEPLARPEMPTS